jgi:hypothetical protein
VGAQHQAGLGVCVVAVLSAEAERSWRKFGCGGAQSPVRVVQCAVGLNIVLAVRPLRQVAGRIVEESLRKSGSGFVAGTKNVCGVAT